MQGGKNAIAPANTNVQTVAISFSSSGVNTVLAGVALQTIRIHKIVFTCHAATNLTLKSGTTALSGALEFVTAGDGMVLDFDIFPVVIAAGADLIINNSNAVQVSGMLTYTQG